MGRAASFFEHLPNDSIRCGLCPHNCLIENNKNGDCRTRKNENGELVALTYGYLKAAARDPVEKKPLFHFWPGSHTFSIASSGCNLACPFCQNHRLSQSLRCSDSIDDGADCYSPEAIVNAAMRSDCESISFTYSEPILQFEFAKDVAILAKPANLSIVFVTNGQAQREPAEELAKFIDAANVDLKCFDDSKYKTVLGGNLNSTLRTIEILVEHNVWVEVTTLVIPGFNDSDKELKDIAQFIKKLGDRVPWHVSRFHPDYQWTHLPATPRETLVKAMEIGKAEGLCHVYVGNLPGDKGEKTHCPNCESVVIDRRGYHIASTAIENGRCAKCNEPIAGVGIK